MLLPDISRRIAGAGKAERWPFEIAAWDPESAGLMRLIVAAPQGMVDLALGLVATRAGSADSGRISPAGGLDAYFDGVDDQYSFGTDGEAAPVSQAFTVVWESELDSFVDIYPLLVQFRTGLSQSPLRVFYSSDTSYDDITVAYDTTNKHAFTMPAGVSRTGERHWGVWSYNGQGFTTQGNHKLWINGLECAVTTATSIASVTDDTRVGGSSGSATDWNGSIRQVRLYNREWSHAEAVRFWHPSSRDSLFKGAAEAFHFQTAGGGNNAALAGSGGTCAVGTLLQGISKSIAGAQATASAGVPTLALTKALSGNSAAASAGTLNPSVGATVGVTGSNLSTATGVVGEALSATVVGVQAASASGSLSPSAGATASISGVASATATGALAATLSITLAGTSATTSVGTLALPGSYSAVLTASQTTTSAGAATPSISKAIVGVQSAAVSGASASVGITKGALGGSVATSVGALAASISITLAGTSANSATGSLSVPGSYSAALGSSALSSLIGSLDASLSVGVSGGLATASAGTLTRTTAVIGSHADTAVGALTVSVTNAVTGTSSIASSGSVTVAGGSYSASLYGSSLTTSSGLLTVLGAIPGPGESLNLSSRIATTKMLSSPVRRSVSLVSRIPQ